MNSGGEKWPNQEQGSEHATGLTRRLVDEHSGRSGHQDSSGSNERVIDVGFYFPGVASREATAEAQTLQGGQSNIDGLPPAILIPSRRTYCP